jgi:hypothetical protein
VTNADELGQSYDIKNNLELISLDLILDLKPNTNYSVTVRARSLAVPQPYALVITGEVGEFLYSDSSNTVSSGLSHTAKVLIIVASVLTFTLTSLVLYIGFMNPARRRRINQAKELLRAIESVFYDSDRSDQEEAGEGEEEGRVGAGEA